VETRINDIEAKVEVANSIDLEPLYRSSYLLQERTKFLDEKDWDNTVKRVADIEDKIRAIGKRLDDAEGARQLQQQVVGDTKAKIDEDIMWLNKKLERWKAEALEEEGAMLKKLDILRRSIMNGIQAIQRTYRGGRRIKWLFPLSLGP